MMFELIDPVAAILILMAVFFLGMAVAHGRL